MTSEGVSLPLIHEHLMVPWSHQRKGDCCGRVEAFTDGYYCEMCDFFVHKSCSEFPEYIEHTSHPGHIFHLRRNPNNNSCDLCGRVNMNLFYRCEVCDFDMDLHCTKYPPPDNIDISETHLHKLNLYKRLVESECGKCGKIGEKEFLYRCDECDLDFHMDCVWHPPEVEHPLEYTKINVGNKMALPLIHEHLMVPWNDMAKGDCCGRFSSITDGFYCESCDFFVHKKCSESSESIQHPSHSIHTLQLRRNPDNYCNVCAKKIVNLFYSCGICDFHIDLHCLTSPPPDVIDLSGTPRHKLVLLKERIRFDCYAKCGKSGKYAYAYKYHECDLAYHVDCIWHPPEIDRPLEVNHPYHSLHPLKLLRGQPPKYSDEICRLCGKKIDNSFYHCSSCNFTLDMRCVLNPPRQSLLDLKAHDHQLTLLSRLDSFTCNACALKGDRSRYVCSQCGFTIHHDCLTLPRVININRHGHRVARTSVLGVVDSICGVCRKKVNWIYGGYSCQRCPNYVVHSKCATRKDVWNGKELEGLPEEIEDIEPYVVIDENTIQHFSHKHHYLRLNVNGVLWEENKRCSSCNHPVCLRSFYGCIDCDFVLHQNCAEFPKKKWHVLHNEQLTLVRSKDDCFRCYACLRLSNGSAYVHGKMKLDVRCGSIAEPFVHPSHAQHPLYYIPRDKEEICNGCNNVEAHVLRCIEDGYEFVLGFKCATLPQVVKHRVDDHPLSLCYSEKASGKCWCDICEKESDTSKWFYTCKDHRACLHTKCVVGDFVGLMPGSTIKGPGVSFEVLLNNSVSRPICEKCKSRCMYPIILKVLGTSGKYICSVKC